MAAPERDPGTKPLLSIELWQLAVIVVGIVVFAWKFLLGAGLPKLGMQGLLVVFLLVVLAGLLVLRARKRNGG